MLVILEEMGDKMNIAINNHCTTISIQWRIYMEKFRVHYTNKNLFNFIVLCGVFDKIYG